MKNLLTIAIFASGLCYTGSLVAQQPREQPKEGELDILSLREVPPGMYEASLQYEGRGAPAKVKFLIEGNKIKLVESQAETFKELVGSLKLLGNGVFFARLQFRAGRASQIWIFHVDGSATIKEIPDRGEKQTVRRVPE